MHRLTATDTPMVRYTRTIFPSYALLDLNMPKMSGFEVLKYMNTYHWIEEFPVIVISAEEETSIIEKAYNLGAVEYIQRPFDAYIIKRRVMNTLVLYANQKRLTNVVINQVYEKEENNKGLTSNLVTLL